MPDIPPVRNLPDSAEPWGRFVDKKQQELSDSVDLLKQSTANGNSTVNASFDQLAAQIDEINKRKVYIESTDGIAGGGGPLTLVTVNFVLEESRNVLFQAYSPTWLTVNNANAQCVSDMQLTGIPDTSWGGGAYGTVQLNNGPTAYRIQQKVINAIYWQQVLAAGSYAVGLLVSATTVGASSSVTWNGAAVSAQILERAPVV